jgi:hypothetical protein
MVQSLYALPAAGAAHQHGQQHVHVVADLDHDDGQRNCEARDAAHEGASAHQGKEARVDPGPGVGGGISGRLAACTAAHSERAHHCMSI